MNNPLLEIVTNYKKEDYMQAIQKEPSAELIYNLSAQRHTIIDFFEWEKTQHVLELAAGSGVLTEALVQRAGFVYAITDCEENRAVVEKRTEEAGNLHCEVLPDLAGAKSEQHLRDLKQKYCPQGFDVVTLIGVTQNQPVMNAQILRKLIALSYELLSGDGVLLYAGPNRYGMKYFAGAKEDRLHRYFAGIEGYVGADGAYAFSRKELQGMLDAAGYETTRFYYPHADYRLPLTIYSDARLPHAGELAPEQTNYDDDRLVLFDEGHAYDGILAEGMYPFFANSYLIQATKGKGGLCAPDYARYAVDRSRFLAVRTRITGRRVQKDAIYPEGRAHIDGIVRAYENLSRQYAGRLAFNQILSHDDGRIELAYVEGEAVSSQITRLLSEQKDAQALEVLDEMLGLFSDCEKQAFVLTPQFVEVFGEPAAKLYEDSGHEMQSFSHSDIDLVPQNVIRTGETYQVIDYEWTFDFPIPAEYIRYRALWMMAHENGQSDSFRLEALLDHYHIDQKKQQLFDAMEVGFQSYVCGQQQPLRATLQKMQRQYIGMNTIQERLEAHRHGLLHRLLRG